MSLFPEFEQFTLLAKDVTIAKPNIVYQQHYSRHDMRTTRSKKTVMITQEDYDRLKQRDEFLKRIDAVIEKAYEFDENGNEVDNGSDLCTIGEGICSIYGYI